MSGRELDALIAEKVIGWTHLRVGRVGRAENELLGNPPHLSRIAGVPRYSTDIAATWPLVEKFGLSVVRSEDGWYALKPEDIQHGTLRGTAYPTITLVAREFKYPEPSETAPLAICRAALAAVEAA